MSQEEALKEIPGKCPTPGELGHSGWNVLHTAAAVYPHKPSKVQQEAFSNFIYGWSHAYACSRCGYHMRRYLERHPPVVTDKFAVNRYMCQFHNMVNKNVGKPIYDCDPMIVLRRWHPTFPEMEDTPTVEEQIAELQRAEQANSQEKVNEGKVSNYSQQKQEEELEYKKSLESVPQHRPVERWRSSGNDENNSNNNNNNNNNNNINLGRFTAGWGKGSTQENQQKEEIKVNETNKHEVIPLAESSQKKWWFFGGGGGGGATATVSSSNNSNTDNVGKTVNSNKEANDEANVASILKKLKACMVYCPENEDKNTKLS